MKRIRLIEEVSTEFDKATQPTEWEADRVDYVSSIRQLARRPLNAQAGADYEEMQKALRLLDALDGKKVGDILALEDADWNELCARAKVFKWGVNDLRLVRFTKTILDASEWPVDATQAERGVAESPSTPLPEEIARETTGASA